jgi:hypothetical protein
MWSNAALRRPQKTPAGAVAGVQRLLQGNFLETVMVPAGVAQQQHGSQNSTADEVSMEHSGMRHLYYE